MYEITYWLGDGDGKFVTETVDFLNPEQLLSSKPDKFIKFGDEDGNDCYIPTENINKIKEL